MKRAALLFAHFAHTHTQNKQKMEFVPLICSRPFFLLFLGAEYWKDSLLSSGIFACHGWFYTFS